MLSTTVCIIILFFDVKKEFLHKLLPTTKIMDKSEKKVHTLEYCPIPPLTGFILSLRINHESGLTICGLVWNPKGNNEIAYTDNQVTVRDELTKSWLMCKRNPWSSVD